MIGPSAFRAIYAKSAELGIPVAFRRDLTHWDALSLLRCSEYGRVRVPPFYWIVRESGTHIVWEHLPNVGPFGETYHKPALELVSNVVDTWPAARVYFWDGDRLVAASAYFNETEEE